MVCNTKGPNTKQRLRTQPHSPGRKVFALPPIFPRNFPVRVVRQEPSAGADNRIEYPGAGPPGAAVLATGGLPALFVTKRRQGA